MDVELEPSVSEDAVFDDAGCDSSCEEPDTAVGHDENSDSDWEPVNTRPRFVLALVPTCSAHCSFAYYFILVVYISVMFGFPSSLEDLVMRGTRREEAFCVLLSSSSFFLYKYPHFTKYIAK